MKNRLYKSFILGISTAIAASASYALITPENTDSELSNSSFPLPLILPDSSPLVISNSILSPSALPFNRETSSSAFTTSTFPSEPELISISHKIKRGESLSTIFSKLNLSKVDLLNIIYANKIGKQFSSISPGKQLIAKTNPEGQLQQLIYKKTLIDTLQATRNGEKFDVQLISKTTEKRIASFQKTISSSLFLDAKDAGLSDKLIMQLANIFAWDIDFALSLHKGDQFTIVYEDLYIDNKQVGSGNIISAEFISQGQTFTAVRFEDKNGNASYFTPEGKSMRKAFLRTPVDFARISSRFNLKRKHPVLNKIRAHKGVDYAAKKGTPIKTTGDGKIIFRGFKGGYGRVIIVQHGQKYSSLYAHLSKFKKGHKTGARVKQGQIIGYVGKSGLATGSHLHYEFRVNGVHRNPLTVKLPHAEPIEKSLLTAFKQKTQPLIAQLNKAKASTLFARNESKPTS